VALTATVPLPVPEAGDTVSQAALSLADQVKVPPPVLLMLRLWAAGLLPPCWAENDKLVGLAPMAGGTGAGGEDEDDAVEGLTSCVSPGISAARRDIDRPPVGVLDPLDVFFGAAAFVAPANAVVPVDELRGAIVFGVAVVMVVVAAVPISVSGAVAGAATVLVLFEIEVSLDRVVVSF
jgi:hypothetical protein